MYKILIQATMLFILIFGSRLISVQANDEQVKDVLFKEEDASFTLLSEVKTSENFVRLKDLTEHVIENAGYREMLICKRPLKDKPLTLTKEYLERLFKTNGMDEKTFFLMDIPPEVRVFCSEKITDNKNKSTPSVRQGPTEIAKVEVEPFTEIDSSEILLRLSNYIEQQLKKNDPQISLYQPHSNSNWKVKVPEDYDLKIMPGIIIKSNSVIAKIGVYNNNVLVDIKSFTFRADIFIKALVADTNLDKGQVINKGSFSLQLVPYSIDAMNYIRDEKALLGLEVQRNIKAGEGLEGKDLNTPILIKRGASVNIVVKEEGFSIRTVGVALAGGRIGDQIQVSMKNTEGKLNCTITGDNTVDIIR